MRFGRGLKEGATAGDYGLGTVKGRPATDEEVGKLYRDVKLLADIEIPELVVRHGIGAAV